MGDVSIGKRMKKMLSYVFQRKEKATQKEKLVQCDTKKGSMYAGGSSSYGGVGLSSGSGLTRRFRRRKANQAHEAYT